MYNYIITSDDKEAVVEKIESIKKSIKKNLDVSTYDLENDNLYNVIDEISTISMFGDPKFVVVKSLEKISKVPENILLELLSLMNNINIENFVVFVALGNIDFRVECFAKIRQFSTLVDIKTKNVPFDKYAADKFSEEGYDVSNDALSLLVSYSSNLSTLKENIEILKCYKADDKKISTADVLLMVKKPLDDKIYNIINLVLIDDKLNVLKAYEELKILNVSKSTILSKLISQFQELYNVYIIAKGSRSKDEAQETVARLFNVRPQRAYYMVKNTKNISLNTIKNNLDYLMDLDLKIKTGQIQDDLGLELYFLR
ncbi:MAG: hypothetical protein IJU60_03300 [Acholeplasmatales bacterium]|nr:hypothetical protein [Acholeplasmatales bacterium]